jgi:hypothetical protein
MGQVVLHVKIDKVFRIDTPMRKALSIRREPLTICHPPGFEFKPGRLPDPERQPGLDANRRVIG